MLQRRMKFVGELVAGAAHATTLRASALNHKLWNHAVKNQTVIERPLFFFAGSFVCKFLGAFGQSKEIFDCLWSFLFQKPNHNIALRCFENGVGSCCSAHAFSL